MTKIKKCSLLIHRPPRHPSYRRRLHPLKKNSQLEISSLLWVIFALLDPGPADCGSRSTTLVYLIVNTDVFTGRMLA
jgi:hypothetical protein